MFKRFRLLLAELNASWEAALYLFHIIRVTTEAQIQNNSNKNESLTFKLTETKSWLTDSKRLKRYSAVSGDILLTDSFSGD